MSTDTAELSPRLSQRARSLRQSRPRVNFADVVLAPFWALGWLVFWLTLLLGEAVGFAGSGVQLGWVDARKGAQGRGLADRWPVRPKRKASRGPG